MPNVILNQATKLSKIAVADKPPLCGGQIYYISPEQFQQKFSCGYSENLSIDSECADQYTQRLKDAPISEPSCDINHHQIIS